MADKTGIEWTGATWNPVVGCSLASPGCTNCYAMKQAERIVGCERGNGRTSHYEGTTEIVKGRPVWTGRLALAPDHILTQPLLWKKPRTIFVNSMGDLFHEDVPEDWIDRVFAIMALCPQHTFQILTKRADRMREYCTGWAQARYASVAMQDLAREMGALLGDIADLRERTFPLPNVWLGVSAEDQRRADERIPALLATPAALRFVSCEPLLGPLDLNDLSVTNDLTNGIEQWSALDPIDAMHARNEGAPGGTLDWVICGGESGPNARPMHPDWARALRDQCQAAGVPFFFKQWGEWVPEDPHGMEGKGEARLLEPHPHADISEMVLMRRVGKKAAGNHLDGRQHLDMPNSKGESNQ